VSTWRKTLETGLLYVILTTLVVAAAVSVEERLFHYLLHLP
jgi:hypothetical protein